MQTEVHGKLWHHTFTTQLAYFQAVTRDTHGETSLKRGSQKKGGGGLSLVGIVCSNQAFWKKEK